MKMLYLLPFLYFSHPIGAMKMEPQRALWELLRAFNGSKHQSNDILALINTDINPNHTQEGISLLNWAAFNGTVAICAKLIASGATIEPTQWDAPTGWYKDEIGPTPFITAVQQWKESLAILLIKNGASIHQSGPETNDKPLLLAIRRRMFLLCSELLERGADVNAQTLDGTSALSYAYANGWPEGAALLIKHGAQPEKEREKLP